MDFSEKKKEKQKIITKMTTIAVIAFSVLAMGILGGSAYGQPNSPSPPACPPGYTLERGQCFGPVEIGKVSLCPEGYEFDFERSQCVGKPGRPADAGN